MQIYKKLYLLLFNSITDALECIESDDCERAKEILIMAQQKAEDIYVDNDTI